MRVDVESGKVDRGSWDVLASATKRVHIDLEESRILFRARVPGGEISYEAQLGWGVELDEIRRHVEILTRDEDRAAALVVEAARLHGLGKLAEGLASVLDVGSAPQRAQREVARALYAREREVRVALLGPAAEGSAA